MSLFRPDVDRIAGYVPGEQPQESGWTKLNTNENPYPPSPRVAEAVQRAAGGRLNIYPDPLASQFRQAVADLYQVEPDWILPANGSDENLTILFRTFVDPGELASSPYPSYVLYETLADIQGAGYERLALNADWSWNWGLAEPVAAKSKLVLVPNPNSPSGNIWTDDELMRLLPDQGVLVVDEAYGDFRDASHGVEILQSEIGRRIVVTRTLSKSYSLAGIRCGFAIAHPDLIAGMRKVKDSYNCNTLTLAAGLAAVQDQEWMQHNTERIRSTRSRLTSELRTCGFDVVDSQANFVWATRDDGRHEEIYSQLKQRRILVRYMSFSDAVGDDEVDGLRISIGTDEEIDIFLRALSEIL